MANKDEFVRVIDFHVVSVKGNCVSGVAEGTNGEERAVVIETGDNVGATCCRAQCIANEVGFVGGGHGVTTRDFDAEGVGGEASICNGKIDSYERIRGASICNEDTGR